MKQKQILLFALDSMRHANIRTALTITAIIIGVFSVALLTGVSKGMQESITANLNMLGTDMIMIAPVQATQNFLATAASSQYLAIKERFYEKDVEKIKSIEGVKTVLPVLRGTATVWYKDKKYGSSVMAVPPEADNIITTIHIEQGRWIKSGGDVVIGSKVGDDFGQDISVGKKLVIENKTFTVVGVLQETGTGLVQVDNALIIPYSAGREVFSDIYGKDEIAAMLVKTADGYNANDVGKKIDNYLMSYKRIKNQDEKFYTVVTPEFIGGQVSQITDVLNIFFVAVASISIIVGLVGVGNTMYMNVIDRYKSIAVMKSLGGKRREILMLYVFEGGVLGILGAILGSLLGVVIGVLASFIIPFSADYPAIAITIFVVALGSGIAAYIPAGIASRINAAEALRYE